MYFGFLSSSLKALYSEEHIYSHGLNNDNLSLSEYLPSETPNSQFNSVKKYSLHNWKFIKLSLHFTFLPTLTQRSPNALRQVRYHSLVSTCKQLFSPWNIRANLFQNRTALLAKDVGFHDVKTQFRQLERHSYGKVTLVNKWR